MSAGKTKYTSQYIDNLSFDDSYQEATILPVESDGTNLRHKQTDLVAQKITVVGGDTYVAVAPIGTAQGTAGWQAKKISTAAGTTTITWAGVGAFNQVATDLTALTYE